MMLAKTWALCRKSIVEPSASLRSSLCEGQQALPEKVHRLAAVADMEIDRQVQVGTDLPQRIPVGLSEVGNAVVLRAGIGVDTLDSHLMAADGLLDRQLHVPPRHQRHPIQAAARFLLKLGHRVVIYLGAD